MSVGHVITGRPVNELSSLSSSVRENPRRDSENEQIRILLERQREQILADCQAEIRKHEFQADYYRRSIQKLNGVIESQRGEINRALAEQAQRRRDQQLHEQLSEQNRDVREAHVKSLNEMEELKRLQGSTFDEFSRRKLIEDRDTILELTTKIQELQNEINCMNDSRDFKDAESVRSGLSHVPSQPALLPPYRDLGGMLSRKEKPWIPNVTRVNVKIQTQLWIRDACQDRQPEIHSTLVREDFQRIKERTNNDCRFRIFILTNS